MLTTITRTRALAGFRPKRVVGDQLGTSNGVNLVIAPRQFSFFVSPERDVPTAEDINVMANGSPVAINTISENAVVLAAPPAGGATITVDYWGSNLSNAEVGIFITEVESQIVGMFAHRYTKDDLAAAPVISKITAYLAAAAMMEQGYMTGGVQTNGAYPPDRLRRVATDLLSQVYMGVITLVDADLNPLVEQIESWVTGSNYEAKDRVFEADPFNDDVRDLKNSFDWS